MMLMPRMELMPSPVTRTRVWLQTAVVEPEYVRIMEDGAWPGHCAGSNHTVLGFHWAGSRSRCSSAYREPENDALRAAAWCACRAPLLSREHARD
jgi:hypothetical protein